jgi:hypothetical protein
MGARGPCEGSGVNADAAICRGFFGLTAIVGSLSWWVSPLSDFGIMLTIKTVPAFLVLCFVALDLRALFFFVGMMFLLRVLQSTFTA